MDDPSAMDDARVIDRVATCRRTPCGPFVPSSSSSFVSFYVSFSVSSSSFSFSAVSVSVSSSSFPSCRRLRPSRPVVADRSWWGCW